MSRLNDLIRQLREKEPALADDIAREVGALTDRRAFGLNFERHTPEAVELPGRRVRRGDKVRVLPPRGTSPTKTDDRLWSVEAIVKLGTSRTAAIRVLDGDAQQTVNVDDLVVVAEFRDPIYPGLVSTGRIERGDKRPFHTVIDAENFHALQTLLFTHRGSVDCIYIDPPYNTGKPDWKYNNRFIESDDLYRHSKWLAFMERRLQLAAQLLNPAGSVLIVSIDEKEYLRLGVLLEQVFPSERIQMISTVINRKGVARGHELARVNEFLFAVFLGNTGARQIRSETLGLSVGIKSERLPDIWNPVMRRGTDSRRVDREGCFYPVYIDEDRKTIDSIGGPLGENVPRATAAAPTGTFATWPIRRDGSEGRWQVGPDRMRELLGLGYLKLGNKNKSTGMWTINYLIAKDIQRHNDGELVSSGRDESGAHILRYSDMASRERVPKTIWNIGSHDATEHGSNLLRSFLPGRDFPFPKSLYAVEDALRFLAPDKRDATILDFFAGSGTTAHAVMRLNKEDGGERRSISITNNEASADEQTKLRAARLRPGDPKWEEQGVFEHVTRPRITAAATGRDFEGQVLEGQYRFNLEKPYSDGFSENVEFMKLTYETPLRVASGRDFSRIAPLLWLRAGAQGRRIDDLTCTGGWDVAETYGVIEDFDHVDVFARELANRPESTHAFVVTDDDWLLQSVCASLPEHVEPVRLYEAYLRNFEFEAGASAR